jgi:undecaprenyl-diphosphatase
MSYIDAIILGILQGLTEFLPVSSSGHLVLAQRLMDVNVTGVGFEIVVHVGSLLAVVVAYRVRILKMIQSLFSEHLIEERREVFNLIIATIPAVIAGVFFKSYFESAFENAVFTSAMLLVTGGILLSTRFTRIGNRDIRAGSALLMGIGQAMAILPGISRSGSSIATGMFSGVQPSKATDFSFLMAIPAIAGALIFKLDDLATLKAMSMGPYAVGAVFSFITSLLAVYSLLKVVRKGKFFLFGPYCLLAGGLGLYLFL